MVPGAHPSPQYKQHLDWFSRLCRAHDRDRQTETDRQTEKQTDTQRADLEEQSEVRGGKVDVALCGEQVSKKLNEANDEINVNTAVSRDVSGDVSDVSGDVSDGVGRR